MDSTKLVLTVPAALLMEVCCIFVSCLSFSGCGSDTQAVTISASKLQEARTMNK